MKKPENFGTYFMPKKSPGKPNVPYQRIKADIEWAKRNRDALQKEWEKHAKEQIRIREESNRPPIR